MARRRRVPARDPRAARERPADTGGGRALIAAALERLRSAGIAFGVRGPADPPPGGDVDVLVRPADARAASRTLEHAGFHRLAAAGHPGHRFHLGFDAERARWLKLDLNLVDDLANGRPAPAGRVRRAVARRLPLAPRRLGPVIALLGPDGAGKGTVIERLRAEIPIQVTTIYMGNRSKPRSGAVKAAVGRLPGGARQAQWRIRRALRAALPAWRAHALAWRGDVVLCDRHPLEALALEPDALPGPLARLIPWPDEIVLLDAPAAVLFARKGEHSPERLERYRAAYRATFEPRGATIVATAGDPTASVGATSRVVWRGLKARRGW